MELTEDLRVRFRDIYIAKLNDWPAGCSPNTLSRLALEALHCFTHEEQEALETVNPGERLGGAAKPFGELVDGVLTIGLRFPKVYW